MHPSFKKSAWCVIDTPTPHPFATLYLLSRSSNLVLLPSGDGGGGHSFIWPRRVCASEQGMVFWFLSLKKSYTISLFKGLKWANYRRFSGRRFSPSGNTSAVRRLGGTPLPELTLSAPRGFQTAVGLAPLIKGWPEEQRLRVQSPRLHQFLLPVLT